MAANLRDQPELGPAGTAERNGQVATDPAHSRGQLPDATFPELIGRLINDASDLADRQVELAKLEIAEAKAETISAAVKIGIGAGVGIAAALLLVIWAWTAFIWFFNWVGSFIVIGPFAMSSLGWVLGVLVPVAAAYVGYRWFIKLGIAQASDIWPPLERTRASLREDLEWLRTLRTRTAR